MCIFLVLPRVHSPVYASVRASTGGDLIKQPDQAQGFPQHILSGIVITILRELSIRAGGILTVKHPVFERHVFPFPPATVTGFTRGKEAVDLDDLPTTLLDFTGEQDQEFAKRGIRERTRELAILEQSLEVEVLNANDPIPIRELGGELMEHIIAQAGNLIMQPCDLSARLLAIF